MKSGIALFALLFCVLGTAISVAQTSDASDDVADHTILKKDVGEWAGELRMFGPDMPSDAMPADETNTMLGEFWVISNFSMGDEFQGQGTFGYDADKKKFIGSWVDSQSPHAMHMEGTWDGAKRTMTMLTIGKDENGKEKKGKITTVHSEDGNSRVFTMFDLAADSKDEFVKTMEIKYTRKK